MHSFLDQYLRFHELKTDASTVYAKIIGIQMLGHQLGYDTVNLIQPNAVRHNMYVTLVGESTIARKDTSQEVGKAVFPKNVCHPNDWTPEEMLVQLSANPQHMQWYGELSYMLKGINRGYMSRIVEIMNTIHGCPNPFKRATREEVFLIEKPYFSFNSTITPDMMEQFVDNEMMHGGFLARHLLPYDEARPRPRQRLSNQIEPLSKKLNAVLMQVGDASHLNSTHFALTNKALKTFNKIENQLYNKKNVLPFAGRYLNYIIAIADILLISDGLGWCFEGDWRTRYNELIKLNSLNKLIKLNRLNIVAIRSECENDNQFNQNNKFNSFNLFPVTSKYIDNAYEVVKPCLKYVETLTNFVDMYKPVVKLQKVIDKHSPITHSQAMRYAVLDTSKMWAAVRTLTDNEYMIQFKIIATIRGRNKKEVPVYCKSENIDSSKCSNCKYRKECKKEINSK